MMLLLVVGYTLFLVSLLVFLVGLFGMLKGTSDDGRRIQAGDEVGCWQVQVKVKRIGERREREREI